MHKCHVFLTVVEKVYVLFNLICGMDNLLVIKYKNNAGVAIQPY
jgi:hypothetical protein